MQVYDLIIMGGGPAGYRAGERAGTAGLKTLLFEQNSLGGTCLNEGCIPSKALLNSAKIFSYARSEGESYGVYTTGAELRHGEVLAHKDRVVKNLVLGVGGTLKKHGVTVIKNTAAITGKTAEGFGVTAGGETYTGKNLLIATGSEPVVPPIPGVQEGLAAGFVLTNREILSLPQLPESLVVIGGGVIGLEMASYYSAAGCHVTVIEMLDSVGGPIDGEIAKLLLESCRKKGIIFHLNAKVTAVDEKGVTFEQEGRSETVAAQKVLLSIGRRAMTQGLGLETIGVYTERGAVVTDACMATNMPGVYAAGDVNGRSMLAHTAYREAEVAVNNMAGTQDRMSYDAIPGVIYISPEVATVGETTQSARDKGYDAKEITLTMNYSGRYMAENKHGKGICKLVVDPKSNRLLGVHMIANYSSEIIYGAAMMVGGQMDIGRLQKVIFPHPTVGEVIREGLFQI